MKGTNSFFQAIFQHGTIPIHRFSTYPLPSDDIRGYPPGTFLGTISGHISGYTDPTRPFWFLWGKIRRGEIHGSDTITLLQKTSGTPRLGLATRCQSTRGLLPGKVARRRGVCSGNGVRDWGGEEGSRTGLRGRG